MREREKETIRKVPKHFKYIHIYWKESTYAWGMHEHVTCKRNFIIGSAQSNPTSTQTYYTHLNAWKYHYNANVMQCMRFWTHLNENPSQNFNKNSSILKNPKIFQKPQNLRFKNMKCMKYEKIRDHTKWFEAKKDWKSRGLKV